MRQQNGEVHLVDDSSDKSIWFAGRPDASALNAWQGQSLASHLGMEFVDSGDDWLTARMPVDDRTRQPFGRLHGGASVALAEQVGSVAANCVVDTRKQVAVGVDINANHIRGVRGGYVIATVRPESLGRSLQVWAIRIHDEAGALVCVSRFTAAIIPAARA